MVSNIDILFDLWYSLRVYLGKDMPTDPWAAISEMKKHLIAAILISLILFALCGAASADNTMIYPAPSAVQPGEAIDHLAASVSAEAEVSAVSLPDGLYLETEAGDEETDVYLRGSIGAAGQYNCVYDVDGSQYSCPITVLASAPTVTACGDVVCSLGDVIEVSVSASSSDGGTLSYQWYVASQAGAAGLPVDGGNEAVLPIAAQSAGTRYFYCQVVAYVNGTTSEAVSTAIAVTVQEVDVSAISIAALPTRTQYTVGEKLDTAGLTVLVTLANGNSHELFQGFGVYPELLDTAGEQRIEVSYQGQTAEFTVQVDEAEILGIGILTLPTKTSYIQGDRLDVTGLSVRAWLEGDETQDVSTGLSCSPMDLKTAGTQTVTVTYKEKTCTFTVQVTEDKPTALVVYRLPDKRQYSVGDALDTAGLILRQVTSANRLEEIRSGFHCSPTELLSAGRQEITVYYGDLSCTFNVTVAEPVPVSPTPSVTKAPEPTPAPSPTPSAAPVESVPVSSHVSGMRALLTAIIVAALLAMAVLGVYVFIANHGGAEEAVKAVRAWLARFRGR